MSEGRDRRLQRKVRRSYVISTVSISLVMFMLGIVSYVTFSALCAAEELSQGVIVSVEIDNDLDDEAKGRVVEAIQNTGMSQKVEFLSRDAKFEDEAFRTQFEVDVELLLGENPLRDSYEVQLSEECSTQSGVEEFASHMRQVDGVAYVAVPPVDVVESVHETIRYVCIVLVVFFTVLLIISLLLLNNTIRLAIYSKRYLINTMKLVGATKWYIMRPLLYSALKQGLFAGVVSALMLIGVVYGVDSFTPEGLQMLDYREVAYIVCGMVAVGVAITVGFSAVAVNTFVNMKSNKIHLY
jgi:cell division transport system permease protein